MRCTLAIIGSNNHIQHELDNKDLALQLHAEILAAIEHPDTWSRVKHVFRPPNRSAAITEAIDVVLQKFKNKSQ